MANEKTVVCALRSGDQKCCFCGSTDDNEVKYGKFYEYQGIVTHYFCLLFSSNMEQKGEDDDGILGFLPDDINRELRRGRRLNCSFCKKSGATLGCTIARCPKKFHYPCGLRNGSLHQFFGEFRSYCKAHRPFQKVDERIKQLTNSSDRLLCYICYDDINIKDSVETLWAPCCKKNAWFHRQCVQQLALSAGYFFKCPLCNNKREFQKAMLEFGIYIPCQDASWELVPNAYEELLYRHNRCDAKVCLCQKGRTHTSTKWPIVLCRLCGSQGIHVTCGPMNSSNTAWECDDCRDIIRSSRSSVSNTNNFAAAEVSDSDSDSDISVGGSSPTNDDLELIPVPVRIRPGPKSFKMLQAKIAKSVASQIPKPEFKQTTESGSSANKGVQHINQNETIEHPAENIGKPQPEVESKKDEIISLSSDEDDAIEMISESIVPVASNSSNGLVLDKQPLMISKGDPGVNLQICNVTTIAPETHEQANKANNCSIRRKREDLSHSISDESPQHVAKKRKFYDSVLLVEENLKEHTENRDAQLNEISDGDETRNKSRTGLVNEALSRADVVPENEEANDAWQVKSAFGPVDSENSNFQSSLQSFYLSKTNNHFDPNMNCDGDAGTGPAVDPRPGTSADSPTAKLLGPTKLDSYKSCLRNLSAGCPSPTPSTSSASNCSSRSRSSTSSSTSSASSDPSGLRENVVHVNDIKFRLVGLSKLEITVQNKYKIDMMLDEVSQKSAGDRLGQEFCCTPEPLTKFTSSCASPAKGNDLDDAKENLNPLSTDTASVLSESRTPFSPQNSEGFSSPTKFVQNSAPPEEEGTSEKASIQPPNCKVSIDLNKIGNLLTSWPHLFKKPTESADCPDLDFEVR